jgi:hypothetical protein
VQSGGPIAVSQAKIERDARTSSSDKPTAVSGGKDIESIYKNTYGFAQK